MDRLAAVKIADLAMLWQMVMVGLGSVRKTSFSKILIMYAIVIIVN